MTELAAVKAALKTQAIETPSWAFGNSGTRFKVFAQPGVPADPAGEDRRRGPGARVHRRRRRPSRCTSRGTRSTTTPRWPRTPRSSGVRLGTINSNIFQDDDYKLGSVTNPDPRGPPQGDRPPARVRRHHGRHRLARPEAVVRRRHQLPGPGRHPRPGRTGWPRRCAEVYDRLGDDQRMLLEYKLFEPAFYTTDVPGLGHRVRALPALGEQGAGRASTPATTRRAPTSSSSSRSCCAQGKLGAFDFNSRFYADDDLMVGAADPFQLFRIMYEVVRGGGSTPDGGRRVHARPVPQHRAEDPGADPLGAERAGGHGQGAAGRHATRWPRRSAAGDVLGANAVLMDAYNTDVRPLLAELREELGLDPDPMAAYARSRLRRADRGRARRRRRRPDGAPDAPSTPTATRPMRPSCIDALATGSAPTRATPTTPAATPRPRAPTTDPVTGERRRAAVGQGLRRRPRHADRGRARRAAAGPAARAGRRLPGRRARGRDGRRVRLLPARQGRRRAVDRHRDARPGRRRRTSTTCTPTPASRSPPPPTARS